ncbi:hypothetical protein JQ604_13945 [Bradyrhizobium jicamae]|uniref:hypothetical protein n=1 Tax=Bradyrhizobium jicamae TaxID=280332 RepID=UPI001BAC9C2B|nr:hypothetical protein [Bradyrhizobium jicamae]MBR0753287.1 hypothetical protein [Bradyrhizobium jicamae]
MAAAVLAMACAPQAQGAPKPPQASADAQQATDDRPLQQATTSDPGPSPNQEPHWAETLSCDLVNARRDIELLQRLEQERDRADLLEQGIAAARGDLEAQTALTARAVEEATRLKQAAQAGPAELQDAAQQARERADRLEQDLAAARRDVETQTALAAKAGEEASRLKQQAGEGGAAELKISLQQERERSARLEQGLAASRRDVETQTALAAKAGEEASRLKQTGDSGAAELKTSLQQERERSARLEQDLAAARHDVETQTALAAKAGEEVSRSKQTVDNGAAELKTSLQQERERSARLEQDLAAVRRDVETQTALAAKAGEEVLQRTKAAEAGAAELKQSRAKADALAQDLSLARSSIYAYEAKARKAEDDASELKQAAANGATSTRPASDQRAQLARLEQDLVAARGDVETQVALAAKASKEASQLKAAGQRSEAELQQQRERSARLEQDLAAARRDVEARTALATKAGEETSRLKATWESGAAELQKSLRQERERSAGLEKDLAAARRDGETQAALATKAGEETARLKQASESSAADLQKSLRQERERAARLEKDLAATRRDGETQAALATKAGEETARLKQASESGAAELQKSLRQERERSARLEQDLAAARRDVETRTALAPKAGEDALRRNQAAEADAAGPRPSRAWGEAMAQDVSLSQSAIHAYEAQARKVAGNEATELRRTAALGSSAAATGAPRDKSIELAVAPAAPVRAPVSSEQAAVATGLVARAAALLRQGDIGAARLVLERAVEMGSAQASFALAETYDPLTLAKWGTYGTRGDANKAQGLYARAAAAGIQEAKARLEALRR